MGRHARDLSALVVAGGERPQGTWLPETAPDLVIAADSGLEHAQALGLHVDVLVGDLDSVAASALDAAIAAGTAIARHPAEKDATDLELALDTVIERGATAARVVGLGGGRLDHFVANLLLLASPRLTGCAVDAVVDGARLSVVRDHTTLTAAPGALCSLLPLGGPATGVETDGLRYPLRRETLAPGSTRGVSNEFLTTTASVDLTDGVLLAVVPQLGKGLS
jgi:thiamine pyrophosphokinase